VYPSYYDAHHHLINAETGVPPFESFFPYFPLMGVFGLPSVAQHELQGFSDARVWMSIFTVLIMIIALGILRAPPDRKIRAAQVLVVLPTGALFLTTGGDDMPILALCLLALVTMQRNRTWATGVILGVACAMKLTAWPFALALLAVSRTKQGRRAWDQTAIALAAVMAVVVVPYALAGPRAFIANVVAFPLGLAGVKSPAASPLPGHIIATTFPALRHLVLPAVFMIGGVILARFVKRHWPLDLPMALRLLAVATAVVICSATATRIGYLIYPLNFWLWAWMLTPIERESGDGVVLIDAQRPTALTGG
jgi:hypothetical protein